MSTPLPPPPADRLAPRDLLALLEAHVGTAAAAMLCAEVLAADRPDEHPDTVRFLGGPAGEALLAGSPSWQPYWAPTWGARGLLYVWDEAAGPAVLEGLRHHEWRVAEMCLKVSAKRGLPCGDDAVRLCGHELPRVRVAAVRAIGLCGDTEHRDAVLERLEDPAEDVRRAAARALERLEDRLDLS
jgi:hypothetical protein